ncbi:hypothetical protein [Bacillus pretiosus]
MAQAVRQQSYTYIYYRLQAPVMPSFTGAMEEAAKHQNTGIIGVIPSMFKVTSTGVSAAIIFRFIGTLLLKAKGKEIFV